MAGWIEISQFLGAGQIRTKTSAHFCFGGEILYCLSNELFCLFTRVYNFEGSSNSIFVERCIFWTLKKES